jgi:thiol-disulfide isomerase/thioredoxin
MKRKNLVRILGICLAVGLLGSGISVAAEKEPVVGYNAGNVQFSAPLTAEDAAYLGLAKPAPFTLKDIKADYVLVESFNTTCPHCMAQAPVLNKLFEMVQNDPKLKNKLKFISVGQGNDATAVKMWKTFHKIPFPVVPDKDSKLGKALNFSPYPVTTIMNKSGKIVWVHVGSFESADEALQGIKKAIK